MRWSSDDILSRSSPVIRLYVPLSPHASVLLVCQFEQAVAGVVVEIVSRASLPSREDGTLVVLAVTCLLLQLTLIILLLSTLHFEPSVLVYTSAWLRLSRAKRKERSIGLWQSIRGIRQDGGLRAFTQRIRSGARRSSRLCRLHSWP